MAIAPMYFFCQTTDLIVYVPLLVQTLLGLR